MKNADYQPNLIEMLVRITENVLNNITGKANRYKRSTF